MSFRRITLLVMAVSVVAVALPSFATAAKAPTFYSYKKCKSKYNCTFALYTNSKNTQIVTLQIVPKCSKKGSQLTAYNEGTIKINSKKKFSVTLKTNSYDQGSTSGTPGKATVSGKVTKKDKATVKYSVDTVSDGCANAKSGEATLKYAGSQQGG